MCSDELSAMLESIKIIIVVEKKLAEQFYIQMLEKNNLYHDGSHWISTFGIMCTAQYSVNTVRRDMESYKIDYDAVTSKKGHSRRFDYVHTPGFNPPPIFQQGLTFNSNGYVKLLETMDIPE